LPKQKKKTEQLGPHTLVDEFARLIGVMDGMAFTANHESTESGWK
jgi:hypothetical protein